MSFAFDPGPYIGALAAAWFLAVMGRLGKCSTLVMGAGLIVAVLTTSPAAVLIAGVSVVLLDQVLRLMHV